MNIQDREKNIEVLGIYGNKDEVKDDEVDMRGRGPRECQ